MSNEAEVKAVVPVAQKQVEFYGDELIAIRADDGHVYVSIRHLCDALGLDRTAQVRRIKRHRILEKGIRGGAIMAPPGSGGGTQQANLLRVDLVPLWLTGLDTGRVKDEVRPKMEKYQEEVAKVLWEAFQEGRLTTDTSFEELLQEDTPATQAYKMIAAMMQLARQQVMLEARLNSQSIQIENHEQRLEYIETQLGDQSRAISESQAMQISQAVKAIGMVWSKQEKRNLYGAVYGRLYEEFEIAAYRQLPARRFKEAMAWLTQWYVELTGQSKLPF